jgi:hypothetical protein
MKLRPGGEPRSSRLRPAGPSHPHAPPAFGPADLRCLTRSHALMDTQPDLRVLRPPVRRRQPHRRPRGPLHRQRDRRAMFQVAVSGRREQEASFFTVVAWSIGAVAAVMWSPRSDSNRRPSDYESKSLRPACAAQTRSACSRQRGRLLSAFLTCGVMAGGMTNRMTGLPTAGPPDLGEPSDSNPKAADRRQPTAHGWPHTRHSPVKRAFS